MNTKHNTTAGNESDGNNRRPSNVLNLPKRTEADNPSEMSSHEGRSSAGSASGIMSPKSVLIKHLLHINNSFSFKTFSKAVEGLHCIT